MEKVVIFIDGSNLYHGLRHVYGKATLNFEKLGLYLCDGRSLVRIYYYNSPVDQNEAPLAYQQQQRFFSYLARVPYLERLMGRLVTRSKTIECRSCGNRDSYTYKLEKGVDVRLGVDMAAMAFKNLYDAAILVAGDGDYDKAVQAVKDAGKHCENAFFRSYGYSPVLFKTCDKFIELEALINNHPDIWL